MRDIVIGSEALQSGLLTRYQLQRYHRRLLPDVYMPKDRAPSLHDRTVAAWLWSRRRAVIAGSAAAALHGAMWVDDATPVEVIWDNPRPPDGLVVRNETLAEGEITRAAGLPVTTVARTAFDLARHLPRRTALVRLDALMRAIRFPPEDVTTLAANHRGARGVRRLPRVLPFVDEGAASPKETWLRLLILDAGLPAPQTQIPICDGRGFLAVLDMGWKEYRVAAEYDGDQHRSDRQQYVRDQRRARRLSELGWLVVRVIKEDSEAEALHRIRQALLSQGWLR